jgi:DNA-binding transcriptional ArsR family regulator
MFTTLLMQQGLPKMMSRSLTCLYTTDAGSLTASELVQRLQVSPASISKAVTFLESQGLIRRERDERRRERYVVDEDVFYQSMIASARSTARLAETARQGVSVLGPNTPAAARLENIARYLDFVGESITRAAATITADDLPTPWRPQHDQPDAPPRHPHPSHAKHSTPHCSPPAPKPASGTTTAAPHPGPTTSTNGHPPPANPPWTQPGSALLRERPQRLATAANRANMSTAPPPTESGPTTHRATTPDPHRLKVVRSTPPCMATTRGGESDQRCDRSGLPPPHGLGSARTRHS